jgi:hypothetical protein
VVIIVFPYSVPAVKMEGGLETRLPPKLSISLIAVVVEMSAVTRHASIRDADIERAIQPECHDGIPRHADRSTVDLPAGNGSDDGTDEAVIGPRFNSSGIRPHSIALPTRHHGFQIQNQIVVARYPNDELDRGSARNGKTALLAANILVHGAVVDAVVSRLGIDGVIRPYSDGRSWFQSAEPFLAIPILSRNRERRDAERGGDGK